MKGDRAGARWLRAASLTFRDLGDAQNQELRFSLVMHACGFDLGLETRIPARPVWRSQACSAHLNLILLLVNFLSTTMRHFWRYRMRRGERIGLARNSLPFPARANNSLRWQKNSLPCLRREFTCKLLNSRPVSRRIFAKNG